jgi:N-methylhydantoinase B
MITVDVRDNIDNVPGGLNLTENTCTGSCRTSVFNNLAADMPHNHGNARSREGADERRKRDRQAPLCGRRLGRYDQRQRSSDLGGKLRVSGMGAPYGQAEGGEHLPVGIGVVSGRDPFKNNQPYVNQVSAVIAGTRPQPQSMPGPPGGTEKRQATEKAGKSTVLTTNLAV